MVDAFDGVSIDQGIERVHGPINGRDWRWRKGRHLDEDIARDAGGLIVAEAVMMALAPVTGRGPAHDLVYAGCRRAIEAGTSLFEALSAMPEITAHLDADRLAWLTDPVNYLGSAQKMVDRVLAAEQ